ncbi:ABC transporter permease [Brachybacterium fresconis]|uniref:ABC-type transport system involved in multi-copper enzyme maturation permease subunit n=1 Tax=Brachybacterium fresconis TaxID=173363 RepID=A0ABS4YK17_9MICO|nr:ABC transporter permease subunit [Brachybacterium fresconis]MBP2409094.1 ABC-type transport system involved in multi-copper enzyme maturation permease subunit [Brachybacterium fresconis]
MALMNGTLSLRPRGLWLVTSLELRQRVRSVRWYVALGIWTLVLLGIGVMALAPVLYTSGWGAVAPVARVMFSLHMLLVLFAMLLVTPALSAGSINGDRSAGTLATLQASLLSPLEIVLGKLLAGLATGLAFLVLAMPSALPLAVLGDVGILYFARVVAMICFLTVCVAAIGLGLSAITQRQLGSVVLAYVLVFGVTVVGPILWGTSLTVLQQEREVTTYSIDYSNYDTNTHGVCITETDTVNVLRMDLAQPVLWPNPVIMLAETAPTQELETLWQDTDASGFDVLTLLKIGMREVSSPPHPSDHVSCPPDAQDYPEDLGTPMQIPMWPMGVAIWAIAALGSLLLAVFRLAVPIKRLGKGTRIA